MMSDKFIKSVEVIPMNKESIFEDEITIDTKDYGYTLDIDTWKEETLVNTIDQLKIMYGLNPVTRVLTPSEVELIASKFKGFAQAPCFIVDGVTYLVKTRVVKTIGDVLKQDFSESYLYSIVYYKSRGFVIRYADTSE